ncbi:MAG: hypothetical protein BEN19_03080 [Epulopiscium sp. Nuni2H_MBin003]|nr:MAG: hypothetical protein BEN19_03080 [Epulopiscium sp. Nuni2H_MBin003]
MQKIISYILILLGSVLVIPSVIIFSGGYHDKNMVHAVSQNVVEIVEENNYFKEQMIGILAKEVSHTEHEELIKANAVMIRTYLLRRQTGLSTNVELVPLTTSAMQEIWQTNYNEIYNIYAQAIEDTQEHVIYYGDELIEPVYHVASSGSTRSALSAYGIEVPYLQAVESMADDKIITTIEYEVEEVVQILKSYVSDIVINGQYLDKQIQVVEVDKSGYIKQIQFGSALLDEESFKSAFNLPSSCVEISVKNNTLTFSVTGDGIGVGLSQNGASEYAKLGSTYKEILEYYYTDINIKNFSQ